MLLTWLAVLLARGDAWSFHGLTGCSGDWPSNFQQRKLSIAETVCALSCPSEPVLEHFLSPFNSGDEEPLLSLQRLDDFCSPEIIRTLVVAVAVWENKIFWKKCHSDDEDTGHCMTPFSDKDTWHWLRMLQEIVEVVSVKDALFLVQCGDEPNVPKDEEAFPVFHPEVGDGFWNIPWPNVFHLKALRTGYLEKAVQVPWQEKVHKAYWRGSLTAPNDVPKKEASKVPRLRVFQLVKQKPELFDVAVERIDNHLKEMWGKKTVKRLVDENAVNFSKWEVVEKVAPRYRYVLNLNGVVSSWRVTHLLGTGSVLLLQESPTNEALHGLLEPWKHYVPVAQDLSNLLEVLELLETNETLAVNLAEAAAEFFARRLRPEDTYCFAMRTLEVSQSKVTMKALQKRGFEEAPNLASLDSAWRGTKPERLKERLAKRFQAWQSNEL